MQKKVMIVAGKVSKSKSVVITLALNRTLIEYYRLVKWYFIFNFNSKSVLRKNCCDEVKRCFNLNTVLIQTVRNKSVEILKSFEKNRKEDSVLKLKRIFIRFDKRIVVRYLSKKKTGNISKTCNGCGHATLLKGRELKRTRYELIYNGEINACDNTTLAISHALMRNKRSGSGKTLDKPANDGKGARHPVMFEFPDFSRGVYKRYLTFNILR